MKTQAVKILERCFQPTSATCIAEAMENQISDLPFVTQAQFERAMSDIDKRFIEVHHKFDLVEGKLENALARTKVELMRWTVSMMVGQTALTVGLTVGIMYFLLKR